MRDDGAEAGIEHGLAHLLVFKLQADRDRAIRQMEEEPIIVVGPSTLHLFRHAPGTQQTRYEA